MKQNTFVTLVKHNIVQLLKRTRRIILESMNIKTLQDLHKVGRVLYFVRDFKKSVGVCKVVFRGGYTAHITIDQKRYIKLLDQKD